MNDEFTENSAYEEPLELDEKDRYESLSPKERLDTVASILAVAALRFKHRNTHDNKKLPLLQISE